MTKFLLPDSLEGDVGASFIRDKVADRYAHLRAEEASAKKALADLKEQVLLLKEVGLRFSSAYEDYVALVSAVDPKFVTRLSEGEGDVVAEMEAASLEADIIDSDINSAIEDALSFVNKHVNVRNHDLYRSLHRMSGFAGPAPLTRGKR